MQILNYYSISLVIGSVAALSSGILVYFNNRQGLVNKTFLCVTISSAVWSAGYLGMILSTSKIISWYFNWVLHAAAILIPAFFVHFSLALIREAHKQRKVLFFVYSISIFFLLINPTKLFIQDMKPKFIFNFCCDAGPLYALFTLNFLGWVIYSLYKIYQVSIYKAGIQSVQLKYAFIASAVGFAGGGSVFLLTFNIAIPPYLVILFALYPVLTAYAIITARLMDIEVIIRETAVYAGIFGFSVGIFVLAMIAGEQALEPYLGGRQWVVPALALFIVTIAVRPIERLVYNTVGKLLFKKKHEYQKTLQDAAVGMSTARDPKKLLRLIAHIVSMKMKVTHVTVLIYDGKSNSFSIKAARGGDKPSVSYASLNDSDVMIDWLREKKQPLTMDELDRWTKEGEQDVAKSVLSSDLDRIKEKMKMLNAAVCVPSFYRDDLLGILALGNKKSGDFFTQDDLELFSALADEAAVALKNSQLYFEIDKKAKEMEALYKREHRLFMHASVAFAAAIDARDAYTHGHSERVTNYSLAILDHLGPTLEVEDAQKFRQRLQMAAVLHDIGKIGISDSILHKPAKLTAKEQSEMERHPVLGAEIVAHIKGLRDILGGIRHHHERYDGKGYPDKLKSDAIPFVARIIAVADTYDAMTSDRPYRKGLSDEIAEQEIKSNGSVQFDPYMVAAFLKAFETGKIRQSSRKTDDEVPATLGMVP